MNPPRYLRPLVSLLLLSLTLGSGMVSAKDPEGKIRSPRKDEKVEHSFTAKGRTSNVPKDHMVILFRPIGEDFLYPCTDAMKPNRSFSETIYHEGTDEGRYALQIRMAPKEIAEKITKWRQAHLKWYKGGQVGPKPSFSIGWLESTKRLAEVEYELSVDD